MITHKGTRTLHTNRLTLRKFTPEDAQQMYDNWASDERVTRHLTWEPHSSLEDSKKLLENWCILYDFPHYYNWGIELSGELIGNISAVQFNEACESCEIGYCLAYEMWNKGIMSEALQRVVSYFFEEIGVHRITIKHKKENPASGKVAQKCGFAYEGTAREAYKKADGTFADIVSYSLLRQEYEARKKS